MHYAWNQHFKLFACYLYWMMCPYLSELYIPTKHSQVNDNYALHPRAHENQIIPFVSHFNVVWCTRWNDWNVHLLINFSPQQWFIGNLKNFSIFIRTPLIFQIPWNSDNQLSRRYSILYYCIVHIHLTHLKYRSKVSWQSLETRSSILENFEDRGSSRVSRRSRPFENLSRPFENLSSRVSRLLSGKNKGLFAQLTFDTSESYGKHILALPADLFWVQVHDISRRICLSENSLRSFSLFNLFYRNLGWVLQNNG